MKFLRTVCHLLPGLLYVVSGLLKLADPVGSSLIVGEYLNWMHLDFLDGLSKAIAIGLSCVEFTLGMALVTGLRRRETAWAAVILTSFFTVITILLVIFNPISDCGCFGEAVHLTNSQTLAKNLVLMLLLCPVFAHRKDERTGTPSSVEWSLTGLFALLGISVGVQALIFNPLYEFTAFAVGKDIGAIVESAPAERSFESTFIYEKDSVRKEFSLDALPDSSWTFVETHTVETSDAVSTTVFAATDAAGDYVTSTIVSRSVALVASVYDAQSMTPGRWERLNAVRDALRARGIELFTVSSSPAEELPDGFQPLSSDYRTLISLNRSNGGLTLLGNGVVSYKWSSKEISASSVLSTLDGDIELTGIREMTSGRNRLIALVCALLAAGLLIVYFTRVAFRKE